MDRNGVQALSFQQLKALQGWVLEALSTKQLEAEREYRERARALAEEYGFKVMGKAGRPKKKIKTKSTNGHDGDHGAGVEGTA